MNAVGPGLHADVNDCPVPKPIFRLRILLGIELLNRVDGHQGVRIPGSVGGVQNIGALSLRHSGDPVDSQLVIGVATAVRLRSRGVTASHARNHSGTQLQQAVEIAAIQGQRVDRLIANRSTQGCVGSVNRGKFSSDRHRLGLLARLNYQVNADVLSHLDQHARVFHGPEAFGFPTDGVGAGSEIVGHILPGAIRG